MLANAEVRRIAGSPLTTSEILANLGMPLCTIWLERDLVSDRIQIGGYELETKCLTLRYLSKLVCATKLMYLCVSGRTDCAAAYDCQSDDCT